MIAAGSLADTGILFAFLDPHDGWHREAVAVIGAQPLPLLTVEPVVSELGFLLDRAGGAPWRAPELLASGLLQVVPMLTDQAEPIAELMKRYRDVPMSLADACLVRLSELYPDAMLLTFDSDFEIYRRFGREPIPLLRPWQRVNEGSPQYATAALPSAD